MPENAPVPSQLDSWTEGRIGDLGTLLAKARRIRTGQRNDQEQWLAGLLETISTLEQTAKTMTHLLSAYAQREGVINPSTVARLTGVTISTAQTRAGGRTAARAWDEAFPKVKGEEHASGGDLQQR